MQQIKNCFNLPQELLKQFYSAIIESVLCSSITAQVPKQTSEDYCWEDYRCPSTQPPRSLSEASCPGACLEGGHGVAPAPLKICLAPLVPPQQRRLIRVAYNIYGAGAVRVHLKSHALQLMSYTNRQRSAAWSRTHPLTVSANYFPYKMPLD